MSGKHPAIQKMPHMRLINILTASPRLSQKHLEELNGGSAKHFLGEFEG
jgi:hypothetical protein